MNDEKRELYYDVATIYIDRSEIAMDTSRLDELETRLMMQEHVIEELNEVVTRQNLEMASLKSGLIKMQDQMGQLMPLLSNKPGDEIPPHY